MKKLFGLMVLVMVLLLAMNVSASAESGYCKECGQTTEWYYVAFSDGTGVPKHDLACNECKSPISTSSCAYTVAANCLYKERCICGRENPNGTKGDHAWGDWGNFSATEHKKFCTLTYSHSAIAPHTFDNDADTTCNDCDYTREVEHVHVWATEWSGNVWYHWYDCIAPGCDLPANTGTNKDGYGEHVITNHTHSDPGILPGDIHIGTCDVCGKADAVFHYGKTLHQSDTHHWYECNCGVKYNEGEHKFDNDADPTCNDCDYTREVAEHTHDWDNWGYVDDNNHKRTCQVDGCNESDTKPHTLSDWYKDGDEWRRHCTGCQDHYETSDTDPATGDESDTTPTPPPAATPKPTPKPHSHSYTGTVTAPTCTSQGYTYYWCSCGDGFMGSYVDALGHAWSAWTSDGSGNHSRTCGRDSSHTEHGSCADGPDADELCDACGYDLHVHRHDGYAYDKDTHWKVCVCGDGLAPEKHAWYVYKKDANKHYWHCDCGDDGWSGAHFDDNNTDKCDDCGWAMHLHAYVPAYDNNYHWDECTCGMELNKAEHSLVEKYDSDFHWTECACGYVTKKQHHNTHCEIKGCGVEPESGKEIPLQGFEITQQPNGTFIHRDDQSIIIVQPPAGVELPEDSAVRVRQIDSMARLAGADANTEYDKINTSGVTYDVKLCFAWDGMTYKYLYYNGVPAATIEDDSYSFNKGYDPETLKAQQQDTGYIGTITIPGDSPIDGLTPGMTYTVSELAAYEIALVGWGEALHDSMPADPQVGAANNEEFARLKAAMDAKKAALDQLDTNDPNHMDAWAAWHQAEKAYEAALAELAALEVLFIPAGEQASNDEDKSDTAGEVNEPSSGGSTPIDKYDGNDIPENSISREEFFPETGSYASVMMQVNLPDELVGASDAVLVAAHSYIPFAKDLAEANERFMTEPWLFPVDMIGGQATVTWYILRRGRAPLATGDEQRWMIGLYGFVPKE